MAKQRHFTGFIGFLVVLFVVRPSGVESVAEEEEEGSFMEAAQSLLQESIRNQNSGSGLNVLGGLVQGLMQSNGGKQLGDLLSKGGGNSAAVDLIANLASVWQASRFNSEKPDDGKGGQNNGLNMDPSIVDSVLDLFSTFNWATNDVDAENNNVDENNNDKENYNKRKRKTQQESPVNWDAILSFAGSMISSVSGTNPGKKGNSGSGGGLESFLSFLPVLVSSLSGQHNHHISQSIPHHDHPQFLPPFLENLHEYWDHFLATDLGKAIWENSGLSELVNRFTDETGQIQTQKIFESLENNAFRRRWIKSLSKFTAEWLKHFTDPEVQTRYLETSQIVFNGFLKAQGYPKESLLNFKKPAKSISAFVNAVFKKHFGLAINSGTYVEPAVHYFQELFKAGHKTGWGFFKASSADLETRLSDTMNGEVIEPVLRVNRAFKFASRRPECAEYVFCSVNQNGDAVKSGLKPAITKASSWAACWFLSSNDSTRFWNLYAASSEEKSCAKYNKNCLDFDVEDVKATTEYYHNEL